VREIALTPQLQGAVLFARYAYPPNALGYCGPADSEALLGMAAEARDEDGLASLAARFDGAWPYLSLIAACNRLPDPLDPRVVEAYWVGNSLLDRVPPGVLLSSLRERFEKRVGRDFESVAAAVALGACAHHSLHVFGVYPWMGLLRRGMEGPPLEVIDQCRVRWGTVVAVEGERVTVRSRGLAFDGSHLVPGPPRFEQVRCGRGGVGLLDHLAPGEVVSLHWDWVCDRLDPASLRQLRGRTLVNIRAVNAAPVPAPAAACDARS
jgi:hypothetical protein